MFALAEERLARLDNAAFLDGKLQSCSYFHAHELPHAEARRAIPERVDDTAMNMQANWF